jgi:DNA-binding transcriptional LysR family regulator
MPNRRQQGMVRDLMFEDPMSTEKLTVFLRRIEEFRTPSFIARRMHLSQAELFALLSAYETAVGAPLVDGGDQLNLTPFARSLLGTFRKAEKTALQ